MIKKLAGWALVVCFAPGAAFAYYAPAYQYTPLQWCGSYYSYGPCVTYTHTMVYAQPQYYYSYTPYEATYRPSYSYSPGNTQSGSAFCYQGYGCYPLEVSDPHQWVYDSWTGTWY